MGLFKNKYEKDLDETIKKIDINMSNNYKDAAQDNLRDFAENFEKYKSMGKLGDKSLAKYGELLEGYKEKMKGYTHKDQKPFWT